MCVCVNCADPLTAVASLLPHALSHAHSHTHSHSHALSRTHSNSHSHKFRLTSSVEKLSDQWVGFGDEFGGRGAWGIEGVWLKLNYPLPALNDDTSHQFFPLKIFFFTTLPPGMKSEHVDSDYSAEITSNYRKDVN